MWGGRAFINFHHKTCSPHSLFITLTQWSKWYTVDLRSPPHSTSIIHFQISVWDGCPQAQKSKTLWPGTELLKCSDRVRSGDAQVEYSQFLTFLPFRPQSVSVSPLHHFYPENKWSDSESIFFLTVIFVLISFTLVRAWWRTPHPTPYSCIHSSISICIIISWISTCSSLVNWGWFIGVSRCLSDLQWEPSPPLPLACQLTNSAPSISNNRIKSKHKIKAIKYENKLKKKKDNSFLIYISQGYAWCRRWLQII